MDNTEVVNTKMENGGVEFLARPYQIDLYEKALKSNTIIYLPTGTGKTFIAMMLLKRLSIAIQKRYSEGGKRTIFAVNTVPLVTQQSDYIARHTGLSCKGYCGDMQVDYWTKEIWLKELEEYQVLVMTCQILVDIIIHGYLNLNRINLIIFDECHRAVNDHPMRQVMQQFEQCDPKEQPRILALSATLLNSNIKLTNIIDSIKTLEITFHSKIATVENVKGYSTNPKEVFIYYESYIIPESLIKPMEILKNIKYNLGMLILPSFDSNKSSKEFKSKPKSAKLQGAIEDIIEHIEMTGIYGVNKCILLHLIQLECNKKTIEDQQTIYIYDYIITELFKIRKILDDEMRDYTDRYKIIKFVSDHVLQLIKILKNFYDNKLTDQKFCCIIFVKRRFTAKVLYYILKDLHTFDEEYKFLIPDYVVGFNNNPFKNLKEVLCTSKWNREVLQRFRNGLSNCVISTDVLDEGVDIPICTLVIRFDLPTDFRSYMQSKGRARYSSSQYAIMLCQNDTNYVKRHILFKDIDASLQQILVGKSDFRKKPTTKEIEENLYAYTIDPYLVKTKDGVVKSVLTEQSAISLVNRYCSVLLKSKFVSLVPIWILHTIEEHKKYQVSLQLPTVSALKNVVFGNIMPSIDAAKRSAAFKTCIKLYEIGELSDNLLPTVNEIVHDTDHLFPNWIEEDNKDVSGTARKRRSHEMQHPEPLFGAYPSATAELYLHILSISPVYLVPQDNRNLTFYNLLNDLAGFGILSAKSIPKIPSFPIFMNVGELNVDTKADYARLVLTSEQIEELKIFHTTIFSKIVSVIKEFMTFDIDNLDNCFLIVPTDNENKINWNVVQKYKSINYNKSLASLQPSDYELALIVPNYRASPNVYIVTQVCDELMPNSCFPGCDFLTYAEYYEEKHEIKIQDLNQSMLEVKSISNKINFIKPRSMKSGLSKRKRADALEDYDEHLVPELCYKIEYPALYWLKATTLPSILHRVSQFLVALDLREIIVHEAKLGISIHNLKDHDWPPLIIDAQESPTKSEQVLESTLDEVIETGQPLPDLNGPEIDVLNTDASMYPWSKEQEPSDLNRNAEQIQLIDIQYYYNFMSTTTPEESVERKSKVINYLSKPEVSVPGLKILDETYDSIGPDPVLIVQALTTAGNDVFDLERLETLGDSYLKFISSLYLYTYYPTYNEGRLTAVKGKMIGNRNLYYCGIKKSIPGYMKVDDFIPMSTFIPPAYTAFRPLQKILLDAKVSPNVLYDIEIPEVERFTGYISEDTRNNMQMKVLNWVDAETQTGIEYFLGMQVVSDKSIADCVEALISVYLKSMGLVGAIKLLIWLNILPSNTDINSLLYNVSQKPEIGYGDPNLFMPWANKLETNMGYKFQNRAYLLQAFTHPSFTENNLTEGYQRLEFLGDAIIDFLITAYITQNWESLNPGDVTDLRSALVNNITFACLAVRYGLHTALLAYAPQLNDVIDRFVKFQEEANHTVDNENLWILLKEEECNMAEYVDVPKVLSDIFESFIAAIYIDTGKDIKKVWEILYALMFKEIDTFSKNIPKQPVRLIYEKLGSNAKFFSATIIEGTNTIMVPLEIITKRISKIFHGFGANKKQAKCAAAKQALKYLRCKNE